MFWVLLMVFFMSDGSKQPLAKVEPSEAACVTDIAKITAGAKPDGVVAGGFQCVGPYSDPRTERKA